MTYFLYLKVAEFWETILHGSLTFLHVLEERHWLLLVLYNLSKDICIAQKAFGNKGSISLGQRQTCSLPFIKDSSSLDSEFLFWNASSCVLVLSGLICVISVKPGNKNWCKCADGRAACYVVVMKSLVSVSGMCGFLFFVVFFCQDWWNHSRLTNWISSRVKS